MNLILAKQEIQSLLQRNQIARAQALCEKLCQFHPENAESWLLFAGVSAHMGSLNNVVRYCKKAINLQPDNVSAHFNLGVALQSLGQSAESAKSYRKALRLNPNLVSASINLGYVILALGLAEESVSIYRQILQTHGNSDPVTKTRANINLSQALCTLNRFSEAEQAGRAALQLDPESAEALNNLGRALKEQGRLQEAADAHRKAVEVRPDFSIAHSNLLLDLNYLPDTDARALFDEHCKWGRQHADLLSKQSHPKNPPSASKRLRVGYVSPDFRAHSVALFITPLITAHDRNLVEVYCYSNVSRPDAWTRRISTLADKWREVRNLNDEELSALIYSDSIDILVDLTGHTANNRLLSFARKPAPVQVTWLGYPNTTGMSTIDYRLTDEWADPPGAADDLNTESLVRLPRGFLCFQPLVDSPSVNDLPMYRSGHITFGCFNNIAKINHDTIALWAELLRARPNARLLLKSSQLSDSLIKQRYLDEFEQAGIDPHRIEIYGHISSTIDHLALYHKVDIALDPFPYNGTTTTCEALWMGVPVVVLEGEHHAGRVGVSLLHNAGLPELIAKTKEDYVRICSELADNPGKLTELRSSMRTRMMESPLLDADGFARSIETAYCRMWAEYCKKTKLNV